MNMTTCLFMHLPTNHVVVAVDDDDDLSVLMVFSSSSLSAPTMRPTSSPPLASTNVGIASTRQVRATSASSSTSTLRKATSVKRPAISLNTGSIILHGPHHDAEKSITTSFVVFLWASHSSSHLALEWTATTADSPPSSPAAGFGFDVEKAPPILLQ